MFTNEWDENPTGRCIMAIALPFCPETDQPPFFPAKLAPVNHWSTIECQIAVVCACLPMCRAMLAHFFPRLVSESKAESYQHGTAKTSQAPRSGHRLGDSHISKTVSYTVDYSSNPETRSDSLVHLVDIPQNTGE